MRKPYWMKSIRIIRRVPDQQAVEVEVTARRWAFVLEMLRSVHEHWTVSPFWVWPLLYWRVLQFAMGWWIVGEIRI